MLPQTLLNVVIIASIHAGRLSKIATGCAQIYEIIIKTNITIASGHVSFVGS